MSALSKYKRKVSDMLPCTAEERKYILVEIDQSLGKDREALSYEAIVEKLGSPEKYTASSIEGMEPRTIALALAKRHCLIRLAVILVLGFFLILAIGVTAARIDADIHKNGQIVFETNSAVEPTGSP